jgi:hypothetical protein
MCVVQMTIVLLKNLTAGTNNMIGNQDSQYWTSPLLLAKWLSKDMITLTDVQDSKTNNTNK